MPFFKYPSIENHYQSKTIENWLRKHPDLETECYVAYEKIDGTNLQLIFDLNKNMQVGTKNKVLVPGESFYNVWNTLFKYSFQLKEIKDWAKEENINLNIYCELFGRGVQSRIDYFDHKQIRVIGSRINGVFQPPIVTTKILNDLYLSHLLPPCLGLSSSLNGILDIPISRNTFFNPEKEGNLIEGIVIQPFEKCYFDQNGSPFILKKKNEKYMERRDKKKRGQPKEQSINPIVNRLHQDFLKFININRMVSVFSHYGPMTDIRQLTNYIKYVLEDAKEDFYKDHPLEEFDGLSKAERRAVFNVGAVVANMLKKQLKNNV